MIPFRTMAVGAMLALVASTAQSQQSGQYRQYRLGANLQSVAALAKVSPAGARIVHERPSLIQELEWRQPYVTSGPTISQSDAVQRIVFTFYDDQLFRLAISYDRQRTNGLTDDDMIQALSAVYGVVVLQSSPKNLPVLTSSPLSEFGTPIAQWAGVDYSIGLYRSSFVSEFRVVVTSLRLDALAQRAAAEAVRVDELEAPQREVARRQKEADETCTAQKKARLVNKATFTP
jgi:hypothetical protein